VQCLSANCLLKSEDDTQQELCELRGDDSLLCQVKHADFPVLEKHSAKDRSRSRSCLRRTCVAIADDRGRLLLGKEWRLVLMLQAARL